VCEQDNPNEVTVSVTRDGYPALVFVEFGTGGNWKATVLTHPSDVLDRLDARARGVLRSYAVDLLNRLAQTTAHDAATLHLPTGTFRLTDDD
jgi:hypothetical protein